MVQSTAGSGDCQNGCAVAPLESESSRRVTRAEWLTDGSLTSDVSGGSEESTLSLATEANEFVQEGSLLRVGLRQVRGISVRLLCNERAFAILFRYLNVRVQVLVSWDGVTAIDIFEPRLMYKSAIMMQLKDPPRVSVEVSDLNSCNPDEWFASFLGAFPVEGYHVLRMYFEGTDSFCAILRERDLRMKMLLEKGILDLVRDVGYEDRDFFDRVEPVYVFKFPHHYSMIKGLIDRCVSHGDIVGGVGLLNYYAKLSTVNEPVKLVWSDTFPFCPVGEGEAESKQLSDVVGLSPSRIVFFLIERYTRLFSLNEVDIPVTLLEKCKACLLMWNMQWKSANLVDSGAASDLVSLLDLQISGQTAREEMLFVDDESQDMMKDTSNGEEEVVCGSGPLPELCERVAAHRVAHREKAADAEEEGKSPPMFGGSSSPEMFWTAVKLQKLTRAAQLHIKTDNIQGAASVLLVVTRTQVDRTVFQRKQLASAEKRLSEKRAEVFCDLSPERRRHRCSCSTGESSEADDRDPTQYRDQKKQLLANYRFICELGTMWRTIVHQELGARGHFMSSSISPFFSSGSFSGMGKLNERRMPRMSDPGLRSSLPKSLMARRNVGMPVDGADFSTSGRDTSKDSEYPLPTRPRRGAQSGKLAVKSRSAVPGRSSAVPLDFVGVHAVLHKCLTELVNAGLSIWSTDAAAVSSVGIGSSNPFGESLCLLDRLRSIDRPASESVLEEAGEWGQCETCKRNGALHRSCSNSTRSSAMVQTVTEGAETDSTAENHLSSFSTLSGRLATVKTSDADDVPVPERRRRGKDGQRQVFRSSSGNRFVFTCTMRGENDQDRQAPEVSGKDMSLGGIDQMMLDREMSTNRVDGSSLVSDSVGFSNKAQEGNGRSLKNGSSFAVVAPLRMPEMSSSWGSASGSLSHKSRSFGSIGLSRRQSFVQIPEESVEFDPFAAPSPPPRGEHAGVTPVVGPVKAMPFFLPSSSSSPMLELKSGEPAESESGEAMKCNEDALGEPLHTSDTAGFPLLLRAAMEESDGSSTASERSTSESLTMSDAIRSDAGGEASVNLAANDDTVEISAPSSAVASRRPRPVHDPTHQFVLEHRAAKKRISSKPWTNDVRMTEENASDARKKARER